MVAVPDVIAFACATQPPNFVPIKGAAVATDEFSGKRMSGAHFCPAFGRLCQYRLYPVKHFRIDNWFVRIAYPDRRHLTIVFPDFFGEIVYSEGFLEQGLTFVFLVAENTADGADAPLQMCIRDRNDAVRTDLREIK